MIRSAIAGRWLPAILALACSSGDGSTNARAVRRDSAGVTIVESPAQLGTRRLSWQIDSVPELSLGVTEGDPSEQFFRITGVGVLENGELFVVNAGSQQIRFFDRSGAFLRSVGGPGAGPGEYRFPTLIPAPSYDSLRILDFGGRVSWLGPEGDFVRSWTPRVPVLQPIGFLAPGLLAASRNTATVGPDSPEGIVTNHVIFELLRVDAAGTDTIGDFPGQDLFVSNVNGRFAFTPVPFDVPLSAAVADGRLYILFGGRSEVMAMDSTGRLREVYRLDGFVRPLTDAGFDRAVEARVAEGDDEAEMVELRRRYGKMTKPRDVPGFERLMIDSRGNLWLKRFLGDDEPRHEWVVVSPEGEALGTIETPRDVRIEQIGDDFLVGVMRDESDIEHVVRYRFRPGP